MILTNLLNFFFVLVAGLVALTPVGALPTGITDAISYFWYVLNSFSFIFPVLTLLEALLFVLAFDLAMILWHMINWLIRKIPGMQ